MLDNCIILHMHLLIYVIAVFDSSSLLWSRDSVLFLEVCNSTSYGKTVKTWKAQKFCKWQKRMWLKDSQTHPSQCAEFHHFVHSMVLGLLQAGRPNKQHSKNTNRCTFGSWPLIIMFLCCVQIWHKTVQGWRFKGTIDLSQVSPDVWCWITGDIHDILLTFSVIPLKEQSSNLALLLCDWRCW